MKELEALDKILHCVNGYEYDFVETGILDAKQIIIKSLKELELYRKLIDLMVCVPQNETYHYVVRYTDDVKFNSILNQINKLSKVGEKE